MLLQHKPDALLIVPTSYVCLTYWYDAMCGQTGVTIETAISKYHASKEKVHALTVSKQLVQHLQLHQDLTSKMDKGVE